MAGTDYCELAGWPSAEQLPCRHCQSTRTTGVNRSASYYVSSNLICSKGRYQVSAVSVLRLRDQIRQRHNVIYVMF